MIKFEEFTGGGFETNAYLLRGPDGCVLIDAPEGADRHFANETIVALILTHGHFDHIADAAAVHRRHGCPVAIHADSRAMLAERGFFSKWGFPMDIEPVEPETLLKEGVPFCAGGVDFSLLEVPGHCPGSVCFYLKDQNVVFGGDTLFAGGVGRWDLPGGNKELLIAKIQQKLLTLPADTVVYPGHGPATTIGIETQTNPFLQG